MAENFEKTVASLMNNLENYVSAKTIVGEPIQYKDVVIFPMADVSFGVAAGAFLLRLESWISRRDDFSDVWKCF